MSQVECLPVCLEPVAPRLFDREEAALPRPPSPPRLAAHPDQWGWFGDITDGEELVRE